MLNLLLRFSLFDLYIITILFSYAKNTNNDVIEPKKIQIKIKKIKIKSQNISVCLRTNGERQLKSTFRLEKWIELDLS